VAPKFAVLAPPESLKELMGRAEELSGLTLGVIAERFGRTPPPDLKRHKGWVGELIERALGATAGAKPAPDFEGLGVELKTLPVDATGRPYESTFVCSIPLSEIGEVEWEASRVRRKLSSVLWVPVEGERWKAPGDRRVGTPLLWSPSADELGALRFDWEELAGRIGRGELEDITAHLGHVLQIRPKARDSRARRNGLDADGAPTLALPRGFYLRATFTRAILARHFG
jgi:DNA mismatch repair protein MutH